MTISTETERVLHDFVRDAVSHLSEVMKDSTMESEDDTRWELGSDGHFRERKTRRWNLWPMPDDEWLHSVANYQACIECMKSDVVIGPHLDRMVGTSTSAFRLQTRNILYSLIYTMVDDDGCLAFTDERFQRKWLEWMGLLGVDGIPSKTVSPLPNLSVPAFPLRLNDELALDRLTADEVTRCCQVGVIRPVSSRFPLINASFAVGIRRTRFVPKFIGDEPHKLPEAEDEGTFGNRPPLRDDLMIDDVLSALRLFKHTQIRTAGLASWVDAPGLSASTSFREIGRWPYGGRFDLSEDEVPDFLELWRQLEAGAARFEFAIHRFNLAFDRRLLADRIVDLVIAAESLFLGDLDEKYRGELRFRFALRAAKFITHPNYGERDIFHMMRQAYDARSAIVHAGKSKKTYQLPTNQSVTLSTFIDTIEELVRLGLRKALSMKQDGKKLRKANYWDDLVFSNVDGKEEHMSRILAFTSGVADWQALLADPAKHWRTGYSARTLAHCWEAADGFPPEIAGALKNATDPLLDDIVPLLAVPEFKVELPGGDRASQNDIFVLARSRAGPVSIMVEGKVNESFGPTLKDWLKDASDGKRERLKFLLRHLGLNSEPSGDVRYQLLHRAASATIEGVRYRAAAALLLVHSFSETRPGWPDYQAFLKLFGIEASIDKVQRLPGASAVPLFAVWVQGDPSFLKS